MERGLERALHPGSVSLLLSSKETKFRQVQKALGFNEKEPFLRRLRIMGLSNLHYTEGYFNNVINFLKLYGCEVKEGCADTYITDIKTLANYKNAEYSGHYGATNVWQKNRIFFPYVKETNLGYLAQFNVNIRGDIPETSKVYRAIKGWNVQKINDLYKFSIKPAQVELLISLMKREEPPKREESKREEPESASIVAAEASAAPVGRHRRLSSLNQWVTRRRSRAAAEAASSKKRSPIRRFRRYLDKRKVGLWVEADLGFGKKPYRICAASNRGLKVYSAIFANGKWIPQTQGGCHKILGNNFEPTNQRGSQYDPPESSKKKVPTRMSPFRKYVDRLKYERKVNSRQRKIDDCLKKNGKWSYLINDCILPTTAPSKKVTLSGLITEGDKRRFNCLKTPRATWNNEVGICVLPKTEMGRKHMPAIPPEQIQKMKANADMILKVAGLSPPAAAAQPPPSAARQEKLAKKLGHRPSDVLLAPRIQALLRSSRPRQEFLTKQAAAAKEVAKQEGAATRIQALLRSRRPRKEFVEKQAATAATKDLKAQISEIMRKQAIREAHMALSRSAKVKHYVRSLGWFGRGNQARRSADLINRAKLLKTAETRKAEAREAEARGAEAMHKQMILKTRAADRRAFLKRLSEAATQNIQRHGFRMGTKKSRRRRKSYKKRGKRGRKSRQKSRTSYSRRRRTKLKHTRRSNLRLKSQRRRRFRAGGVRGEGREFPQQLRRQLWDAFLTNKQFYPKQKTNSDLQIEFDAHWDKIMDTNRDNDSKLVLLNYQLNRLLESNRRMGR